MPAGSFDEARQYQSAAQHWAKEVFPQLLNEHLDQIMPNDDVVYLERIEIHLDQLPWDIPPAEWKEKIAREIVLDKASNQTFATILRQWVFYLMHGAFEKNAIMGSLADVDNYLSKHVKLMAQATLEENVTTVSIGFFKRLFFQHRQELVVVILEKWYRLTQGQALQFYRAIYLYLKTDPAKIFAALESLREYVLENDVLQKERLIETIIKARKVEDLDVIITSKQKTPEKLHVEQNKVIPGKYIACSNAGLVLLFPYLNRFLEKIHLVENKRFKDEASRNTAIQALHFLATGKAFGVDDDYVLPKIVCGVDIREYIESDTDLSDTIRREGDELLRSIVENWNKMQNTSVDALREGFLQRSGKLTESDGCFILQVEESGVDILLRTLPWGFRNFKLPWMSVPLITEWY